MMPEQRRYIDAMTYREMLSHWRYDPLGSELFQGECGEYFKQRMAALRAEVGEDGHVTASKTIGWER